MSFKLIDCHNNRFIFSSDNNDFYFEYCSLFYDFKSKKEIIVSDSLFKDFINNYDVVFPDGCEKCSDHKCFNCPFM